jgi:hypothetical protein
MKAQSQHGTSVLILGESHCTAIARAISDSGTDDFVAIDVRNRAAGIKVDEASFDGYSPLHLVLAFGGTEHNLIGLIETEPKFDFLYPPFEDFDAGRSLIPSIAIESLLDSRIRSALQRALQVKSLFQCPVHVLAPPPPFFALDERAKLPSAFAPLIEAGITPSSIRRKLYTVLCKVMNRAYEINGVNCIDAPPASHDDHGYLRRTLWDKDPTHGNAAYGKLVIEHLKEQLHV